MSSSSKFTRAGVRDYEKRRYRGFDQRLVHRREMKLIRKMLALAGTDDRLDSGAAGATEMPAGPGRRRGRTVLDLPCGYGRFTPLLRERGFDVVSADLSFEMARRAAENASEEDGPRGWFPAVAANAGRLPLKAAAFDLIFSIRFFHHVHDPGIRAAILGEFHRASAGHVLASFYRANGLHGLQRRFRRMFGKSRTNIKMVERGVFERTAEEAGFEVVRVRPLFRGLHAYHLILLRKRV